MKKVEIICSEKRIYRTRQDGDRTQERKKKIEYLKKIG